MALGSRPSSGARHLGVLVAAAVFVVFPGVALAQQGGSEPKNAVYLEVFTRASDSTSFSAATRAMSRRLWQTRQAKPSNASLTRCDQS